MVSAAMAPPAPIATGTQPEVANALITTAKARRSLDMSAPVVFGSMQIQAVKSIVQVTGILGRRGRYALKDWLIMGICFFPAKKNGRHGNAPPVVVPRHSGTESRADLLEAGQG